MAIQNSFPNALSAFTDLIQSTKLPPMELLSDTLINELDQITEDCVLVLDDYHLINNDNIHNILDSWLQFPPSNVHLVISTRRDPPLKLNTLRLRNRINELRTSNLGFNLNEIVSLFEKSKNVNLELPIALTLEHKTEGWITALRLVSLTYSDWKDDVKILNNYVEDTFSLTEYLVEEVVKKQPLALQNLLLKTSILDRFCGELLEVILQSEEPAKDKPLNGQETINWLLKSDLFIIKLDNKGKWFRFHHQFQYLLQNQLKKKLSTKEIQNLHLTVASWFVKNDYFEEVFYHAQQANNDAMAAQILIDNRIDIINKDLWRVFEVCFNKLPAQMIALSPELLIVQVWLNFLYLDAESMFVIIEKIEKLSEKMPIDSIQGEVDFFKGFFCYYQANFDEGEKLLKNAISLIPAEFYLGLGEAELHYALTLQAKNKRNEAITFLENKLNYQTNMSAVRQTRLYGGLALIYTLEGNLSMAIGPAVKTKEIGYENNLYISASWGNYNEALILFNQGKFENSMTCFSELTDKKANSHSRLIADSFAARLLYLQISGQHNKLEEITDQFIKYSANINDATENLVLHSAQARLALLQGDLDAAIQFMRMVDISADEGMMLFWIEIPRITWCRVLIAEGTNDKLNEAITKLTKYYNHKVKINNNYQNIVITLLLALAYHKLGEKTMAIKYLKICVEMGSHSNWIFPFLEYRETMTELLPLVLSDSKTHKRYINKLLKALEKNSGFRIKKPVGNIVKKDLPDFEKISTRESEILLLVSEGMRNKEIANKLFVSEGTVKKHIYNIGQKFGTSSRVDLLNRTRELGFI
jgi:LuxR family maltose regulon positive regulatory protein